MKNSEKPAMPYTPTRPWDDESSNGFEGLSKREYFASKAMQGYLANSAESEISISHISKLLKLEPSEVYSYEIHYPKYVAKVSILYADALLLELEKTNQ